MLVWDQHACLPLKPSAEIGELERYAKAGADFVSVNVGMDVTPMTDAFKVLASFRQQAKHMEQIKLVERAADVLDAKANGRLAIAFDLEGTEPLDGEVAMVESFRDLGVRTMLIAYNQTNRAGGGCHDDPEIGLTAFGREVVREMNRVGMLVDASHCAFRTTMDLFNLSATPAVFSHSNPRGLRDHDRNINDEQIRACAASGGVIGITGVSIFLSENVESIEAIDRAIEYVANLVGIEHVGIGLDYAFDEEEIQALVRDHRTQFVGASGWGGYDTLEFTKPEKLPAIADTLVSRGFTTREVEAVMGGNFLRVAREVWG